MIIHTDEQQRIEENIAIILCYLANQFPGYVIKEQSELPAWYEFFVTDEKGYKQYKLWINGARLSGYSPHKTEDALYNKDIATKMILEGKDGFFWHPDNLEPHTGP